VGESKSEGGSNFFYSNDKAKSAKLAQLESKFGIPKSTFS
jgi:hypothetical protein